MGQPWATVHLEKLKKSLSWSRNSLPFMETELSLAYSQQLAFEPCSDILTPYFILILSCYPQVPQMVSSLFQNYICGFNNRNYRLMLP
jgi:hypothetical protein